MQFEYELNSSETCSEETLIQDLLKDFPTCYAIRQEAVSFSIPLTEFFSDLTNEQMDISL